MNSTETGNIVEGCCMVLGTQKNKLIKGNLNYFRIIKNGVITNSKIIYKFTAE